MERSPLLGVVAVDTRSFRPFFFFFGDGISMGTLLAQCVRARHAISIEEALSPPAARAPRTVCPSRRGESLPAARTPFCGLRSAVRPSVHREQLSSFESGRKGERG